MKTEVMNTSLEVSLGNCVHTFLFLICFCLCQLFIITHKLSVVAVRGLLSSCETGDLGWAGSNRCGTRALEHRLSGCAWAQLLCGKGNLPRPGIKPVSSALAGRFLTTGPPGKSCVYTFLLSVYPQDQNCWIIDAYVKLQQTRKTNSFATMAVPVYAPTSRI